MGLRFRRTRIEDGRVIPTDETTERRGRYVISSIGSIPEALPGIPMKGELFAFSDWDVGRLPAFPTVFSAGNVVTGKGNIVASRKHATHVEEVVEQFLGLGEGGHAGEEALIEGALTDAAETARAVGAQLAERPAPSPEALQSLLERTRARQSDIGYTGDYASWIEKVTPPDLE